MHADSALMCALAAAPANGGAAIVTGAAAVHGALRGMLQRLFWRALQSGLQREAQVR